MELDPLSAASARVVYAVENVSRLIPYINPGHGLPVFVQNACLEAWFTNLRLLAEFLLGASHKKSMDAEQFLPGWRIADKQKRAEVGRLHGMASEYVTHVGRQTEVGQMIDVGADALRARARLVIDALKDFAVDLAATGSDHATAFELAVFFGTHNLEAVHEPAADE